MVLRNCIDFTNPIVIKILFTSLVQSKLEYNTVIWSSNLDYQIQCQTLTYFGEDLENNFFSHGHLYVAFCKVGRSDY